MARTKVNLAYIINDAERKASYKKRKRGLIKKVSEISTLCGVQACAVIYSNMYDPLPEVWPSRQGALDVFERFNRLPEMERTRKMVNQESFTRHRINKVEEQFNRLHKENKRTEMEIFMYQCMTGLATLKQFNMRDDAPHMTSFLRQTRRDILSKMEELKHVHVGPAFTSPHPAPAPAPAPAPIPFSSRAAAVPPPPPAEVPRNEEVNWSRMVDEYNVQNLQSFGHGWEYDADVLPHPYISNTYNPDTSGAGPSDPTTGFGGN